MTKKYQELAFTDAVREIQKRNGSNKAYSKERVGVPDADALGDNEVAFIENCNSFYMASVSSSDWPYVQHRGGPTGFLKVVDPTTLVMPDFPGNKQYVSLGNLRENDKVSLFFMDYPRQARLKIFARARAIELDEDEALTVRLEATYKDKVKVERAMEFSIEAFDWNCPKYILPRYTERDIQAFSQKLLSRIGELEAELAALKA